MNQQALSRGSIFLNGSARSLGNTSKLIKLILQSGLRGDVYDLSLLQIHPFSYDFLHDCDDFIPLLKKIACAPALILCSPIYWYSVSAQLKAFLDRLNELQTRHSGIAKQLRGKPCYAVISGFNATIPDNIEKNLRMTMEFLGMTWQFALYGQFSDQGLVMQTNVLAEMVKSLANTSKIL